MKETSKDILFAMFDTVIELFAVTYKHPMYRIDAKDYAKRQNYHFDIRCNIYYLIKSGLIKRVVEGKEKYYELTNKGYKTIAMSKIEEVGENRKDKWDKLFRIVMFDIPVDKNDIRNIIRRKLERIGFIQMQRSVFVYPFECKQEIDALCYYYSAKRYLKYIVANIIEGEKEIIEKFIDRNILTLKDLK